MRKYIITNVKVQSLLEDKKIAETKLRVVEADLYAEQKMCNHKYVPFEEYDPTDKWFSSSCYCESCGKDGSTWWCTSKRSPDGLCNYKQADGRYNEDNCIYCHQPDERK